MFSMWNPSPSGAKVGDCSVRAVAKALDMDWESAYALLCVYGLSMYDMPNSNAVINAALQDNGFVRSIIPNECPHCYTVEDFAKDHPLGTYVLGTGDHVVCIKDGTINDTWDSSKEIPIYYWENKEKRGENYALSVRSANDPNGVLPDSVVRPANHLD